jgi:hypothetical protein
MINEPMLTTDLEDDPDTSPRGYAKVLRTLAGQLGLMNDYYLPLMDAAKILEVTERKNLVVGELPQDVVDEIRDSEPR